jgi:plastocyanin
VVYGLSRVYLELPGDIATGLATGIALGILAMAWFLSTRPVISGMQVGFIAVVAAGVLAGGAIYAVVDEDGGAEGEGETGVSEPTPGAGDVTGGSLVTMGDNFFEFEGERKPVIEVAAGEAVTWELTNNGLSVHNLHIAGVDNEYGVGFCNGAGEEPCSDPKVFSAGQSGTITFQFDEPGTFIFRCDFHPQDMTGQVRVR